MPWFLKDPLTQFILLGLMLFTAHYMWEQSVTRQDYTIHISADEIERQALIFAGENRRQPTDQDIKALLFAHIEEEVLMREARKRGLEHDDTIIRRRLAQKMRFIIEDVESPKRLSEPELKIWFEDNITQFTLPETRSFSHVYISPEKHGQNLDAHAQSLLSTLQKSTAQARENWTQLGDPFMMKQSYTSLSEVETRRLFGQEFGAGVFAAPTGQWTGPIDSAFGRHLIRIDKISIEHTPRFEEVHDKVERIWQDEAQRAQNQSELKSLIKRYKVNVEDIDE